MAEGCEAKWAELEDLSRERLFMHLVSEAIMISGQVLGSYRMQLESLIDVPVSYASTTLSTQDQRRGIATVDRKSSLGTGTLAGGSSVRGVRPCMTYFFSFLSSL